MRGRMPFILGVLVFLVLFAKLGPADIIEILLGVNLGFFLLALAINLVDELLAAQILRTALDNPKIPFKEVFMSHISGMLLSDVTPGRLGYYYTALSLSGKTGDSKSKSIGVVSVVQALYFFTKVVGCLIASLYFIILVGGMRESILFFTISLIPLAGLVFMILALATTLPQKIFGRIPAVAHLIGYIQNMQEAVKNVKSGQIHKMITYTTMIFILVGVQWYLLAKAIGVETGFASALMLRPLLSAIAYAPTPGGLGFTEGGGAALFTLIGFSASQGFAFVILTRINQLTVSALGLLDLWRRG